VIRAQMSSPRFYANTKLEFQLMIDLAQASAAAWGSLDLARLEPCLLDALEGAEPTQNGQFVNRVWETLPRAEAERGTGKRTLRRQKTTVMCDAWFLYVCVCVCARGQYGRHLTLLTPQLTNFVSYCLVLHWVSCLPVSRFG
jgi:hypothetical protein